MPEVIRAKNLPEHIEARKKHKQKKDAHALVQGAKEKFGDKSFGELTGEEKDEILKAVAIKMGIVKE